MSLVAKGLNDKWKEIGFSTENKWIKIEDMLPPLNQDVIVYTEYNTIHIYSLMRPDPTVADLVWEDDYGFWDENGISFVTHWMPLPQPPEK